MAVVLPDQAQGAISRQSLEPPFRRYLRRAMALPVVVLALAAVVLVGLVLYLQDLNRWVDRTDVMIASANRLLKLTAERENALRGYLLSGDPFFLAQFNAADARMSPVFDGLQDLVAHDEAQLERVRAARVEVFRHRHHAAQQVDRTRDPLMARDVGSHLREAVGIGARIRSNLHEFIRKEEDLRDWRVQRADRLTWYTLIGGIVAALLLGTGVAFATARQMRLVKARYTEALDEQERVERSLRDSEERLLLAEEAARLGRWDWNIVTGEMVWSDRCKALFGLGPDRAVSYDVFIAAIHPDDRSRIDQAVRTSLANRTEYDVEMRTVRPDGRICWVGSKGRAMYDPAGRPVRMLGMALDVTERKLAQEALEEADRRKNEFLGVLSHELRNPLAPIRNSVYVLAHADPASEPARRSREIIARQVEHLTRLVDDLLEVKRLSVGKMSLKMQPIDLLEPVRQTVEDLRPLFVQRRLDLKLEAPRHGIHVNGDATRMAQVIANLLYNAAKFTDAGGHVSVAVEEHDGKARVRVRDDGVGIAPELLGSLFEPFVQGERTLHRSRGGLGLGLALVRGITELHGGTVAVHSGGAGSGTEFEIALPLLEAAADTIAPGQTSLQSTAKRSILIIEDNEDAAASLRDLVEIAGGHEVHVAGDGGAGIDAARRLRPDVIFCDLGLPVLDGYEVARRLRATGAADGTTLVALSGYAGPEDVERSRDAGFEHHLAKPADLAELMRIIAGSRARPRVAA